MLESMTGYGQAHAGFQTISYALEIKSLNGKYFKAVIKLPEMLSCYETRIEQILRARLIRGSAIYTLRVTDSSEHAAWKVNLGAVKGYLQALDEAGKLVREDTRPQIDLAGILLLPGVCQMPGLDPDQEDRQWQIIERLTDEALRQVREMRAEEGKALANDLSEHCRDIEAALEKIRVRAPEVIRDYAQKLHSRVKTLLSEAEVHLREEDLAREVAVFAERADINEELARLDSHLEQCRLAIRSEENAGRKLEFLAQEMLREANTIGSKANDALIAQSVVEIKGCIDRIKEQVMNVV